MKNSQLLALNGTLYACTTVIVKAILLAVKKDEVGLNDVVTSTAKAAEKIQKHAEYLEEIRK